VSRVPAMLYCQHSLGLGHFVRSIALAQELGRHFDLLFLNGGVLPRDIALPDNVAFEHLPPIRIDDDGQLSGAAGEPLDQLLCRRRDRMLDLARRHAPSLLVVELYPFGRRKFGTELLPLIAAVRDRGGTVVSSVRDILVGRSNQRHHDDRAAVLLNDLFDAVLVHSDPNVARLDASFQPSRPLAVPTHYTGYVRASRTEAAVEQRGTDTLVSAGGGAVGRPLLDAALAAQRILWRKRRWPMTLVAGPFLPQPDWEAVQLAAADIPGVRLLRSVPDMLQLLRRAGRSVSQCGYNTALEVIEAGVPSLFVPYAAGQETEQTVRAQRLAALGHGEWMPQATLDGAALADRLVTLRPACEGSKIALDGAAVSAALLSQIAAGRQRKYA
jgi:predicted glycosyltransferase